MLGKIAFAVLLLTMLTSAESIQTGGYNTTFNYAPSHVVTSGYSALYGCQFAGIVANDKVLAVFFKNNLGMGEEIALHGVLEGTPAGEVAIGNDEGIFHLPETGTRVFGLKTAPEMFIITTKNYTILSQMNLTDTVLILKTMHIEKMKTA